MLLATEDLVVEREGRAVVRNVNIELGERELVALVGPNGAGKSTLLEALVGLLPPSSGECLIEDQALGQWAPIELARTRAYLAQESYVHWPIEVAKLVALGRLPHHGGVTDPEVARAIEKTSIRALLERPVQSLSGGELARVLLARMLAVEARIQLLDEPIAGLDPRYQLETMGLLRAEANAGAGVLVVLHDLALAARYCDRVILLHEGKVWADGPPVKILTAENLQEVYQVEAEVDFSRDPPHILAKGSVYT